MREINKISIISSSVVALLIFLFLMIFSGSDIRLTAIAVSLTFVFMMMNSYGVHLVFILFSSYSSASKRLRWMPYILSYILGFCIFILVFVSSAFVSGYDIGLLTDRTMLPTFIIESIVFTTLIILFQNFVSVQTDRNKTKIENAKLKIKSAEAVNLLLKQQMHPHFLFNSLHTIKVLYKNDPLLGENYLVHLADFLRTTISETHSVSASVEKELNLVENYLKMQQMRFQNALQWDIRTENVDLSEIVIPAFSLQPLVENAIKHNYFSDKNPLVLSIEVEAGYVKIYNNIRKKKYAEYSMGTGLMNISERYYMWCGQDLEIIDDGQMFSVKFKYQKKN